jgi:peptide/nickel transport system substrate-binding protein
MSGVAVGNPKLPTNSELRIGASQEFENLNPMLSSMAATTYIFFATRRILLQQTADNRYLPEMVIERPSIENGLAAWVGEGEAKRLTAKFEIRPEVVWGDGTPVTAHDLAFARQIALDDNISIASRTIYEAIEKIDIDATNPKKFTITYKTARWDYNSISALWELLPKHLEEPVYKKYGKVREGYEKNSNYVTNPTNPGLYSGPYVISELKLGSHVSLVRNPKWWGAQKPSIEKITFKLLPNTGTLEANLLSGTIDMISTLGLDLDQAVALEKKVATEKLPFAVKFRPSLEYEHIDLNLRDATLADVRVRRALVHAINRDELTQALFGGRQIKAVHNLSPIDPWFTDDPSKIATYTFSRRTAQKLLDEAGWSEKGDGFRYKDGKKLSFVFMTTSGNKTRELVQTYLQDQWKKVGIEVIVKNEQARVFFGETMRKIQFPHMALYAWISRPEASPRSNLHSSMIPSEANAYSGQNYPGWNNPAVDKLIEELDVEFDPAKRLSLAHQVIKAYTEDVPVIPLYYRSKNTVVPANLNRHELSPSLIPDTQWVEFWDLSGPAKVN